jgi:RNA polymerase sigma factor for flagellar operon FliA
MCAGFMNGYEQSGKTVSPGKFSWQGLTPDQRQEYIDKYSPLIRYVAERLASRLPSHISKDDLISSGILGLIDAVDKFEPDRNILFKTYAEFRIKGAMLDELRAMDWVPRAVRKKAVQVEKAYQTIEMELGRPAADEEVAATLKISLEEFHKLMAEVRGINILDIDAFRGPGYGANRNDLFELIADENAQDALDILGLSEIRSVLAEAVGGIPEKERLVVTLYYYEELTMKEIGEVLGYTESRISQIHTKAVMRLKGRLRRYFNEKTG